MQNQRGNIGLAVLWMVSLAFFLGGSFLPAVLTQNRLQTRSSGNLAALAVAEAGAELAFWEFRYNSGANQFSAANGWVGFAGSACAAAGNTCPFGNCVCRVYTVSPAAAASSSPTGIATITVKDTGWSTPNETKIVSTGVAQGSSVSTTVTAVLNYNSNAKPFEQAIFAEGNVRITQSADVSSYDSGTAFPIVPVDCVPGGTPVCDANIESNSGTLTLDGTGTNKAFVNGTAYIDGGAPFLINLGYARINPNATNSNWQAPMTDIIVDQSAAHNGVSGNISWPAVQEPPNPCGTCVAPSCYTLPSSIGSNFTYDVASYGSNKTYCAPTGLTVGTNVALRFEGTGNTLYVNGPFSLNSGGSVDWNGGIIRTKAVNMNSSGTQLHIRNKTDFYVKGSFSMDQGSDLNNNAVIPTSRKPEYLRLYIQKEFSSDSVHIQSNSTESYAVIYAPTMDILLDVNQDLHGAVIGNIVTLNGTSAAIKYDIQLRNVTDWPAWLTDGILGGGGTPSIKSWSRSN